MTTKDIGNKGEDNAVDYLLDNKFSINYRNWKNRWCEIDIVSTKNNIIYFVEVKYRKNNKYGDGFDAISNKKLKQMNFAAEYWVSANRWTGDYRLAVISVTPNEVFFIEV